MIHELDTITLTHDIPQYNLKQGDMGTIVHSYNAGEAFEGEFISDDGKTVLEAIQRQASCNLIHLETMHKVDIFILKASPYNQEAFQRRRKVALDEEQNPDLEFYFASAEDVILSKLDWFRMGGGVSERQWTDVMGVLKVQRGHLDMAYLQHWTEELELGDLFTQVCRDAGIDEEE